jgi:hypothetical protein
MKFPDQISWNLYPFTKGSFLQSASRTGIPLAETAKDGVEMDPKDRQIIAALQEEGRLTNQELSERVALSPSPCLRRLRILEDTGVI